MSRGDPTTFTAPLSRTDALYFTVTIFATVGFGDISAKSEAARLVVTAQMILDLIILGLGARIILGAVQRGRERTSAETDTAAVEPRPS
jgi:voltage-gated potassium channel